MRHNHTHYWFGGGRGAAKSSDVSQMIVLLMVNNPNVNTLVLRKVGATLRDSVFNQLVWAIDTLGLGHLFKTTVSPLEITYLKTGQKIYFRGADKPIKIKSIKPQKGYMGIVWFEEVDQFCGMEEIRNILQSANRGGDLYWNFYSYNPPKSRDNWVNVERLEEYPDKIYHHSTYLGVPVEWLGEQFIYEAEKLKERKPQAYEHEYLGVATGTGGAVFDNLVERIITQEEYNSFDRFHFGIDFGFAVDPFAWVKLHYDKKRKRLFVLEEIYQEKLKNTIAVEMIKAKHKWNMHIKADCADPKSIAEMKSLGLSIVGVKKGPDSREYGFKFLQDLDEIVVDKQRTPNAFREFTMYEYEIDKNGNYISVYPDKNDHILDACRYALEDEMRNSRVILGNLKF